MDLNHRPASFAFRLARCSTRLSYPRHWENLGAVLPRPQKQSTGENYSLQAFYAVGVLAVLSNQSKSLRPVPRQ